MPIRLAMDKVTRDEVKTVLLSAFTLLFNSLVFQTHFIVIIVAASTVSLPSPLRHRQLRFLSLTFFFFFYIKSFMELWCLLAE